MILRKMGKVLSPIWSGICEGLCKTAALSFKIINLTFKIRLKMQSDGESSNSALRMRCAALLASPSRHTGRKEAQNT